MKKIYLIIFILILHSYLAKANDNLYPVTPNTYKELVDLQQSISIDLKNLLGIHENAKGDNAKLLKSIVDHFTAIETELMTFITLLPLESYHDLAKLLDKHNFTSKAHNKPALEYIKVQCLLSKSFFEKKGLFVKKKIGATDNETELVFLGKLEKHLQKSIDMLISVNSQLETLLKSYK